MGKERGREKGGEEGQGWSDEGKEGEGRSDHRSAAAPGSPLCYLFGPPLSGFLVFSVDFVEMSPSLSLNLCVFLKKKKKKKR